MPSINDRIGSQNVIRVLSNASAPPSRLLNLTDVESTSQIDGNLLIWDTSTSKFVMGRDLDGTEGYVFTGGTGQVGIVTFSGTTQSESTTTGAVIISGGLAVGKNANFADGLNVVGIATFSNEIDINAAVDILRGLNVAGVTSVASLNIGATQVISSGRELQNIASLDATTTATIEAAIEVAPNTFTDLKISGVSTFIGIATYAAGIQVVSGVSTFDVAVDINAGLDVDGQTDLDEVVIAGVTTFNNADVVFQGAAAGQNITFDASENDLEFTDNARIKFGNNDDLEIWHDGTNSNIKNSTGDFHIRSDSLALKTADNSERYLKAVKNEDVKLYYNGNEKFATTAEGVDITGRTETDLLNVSGVSTFAGLIDANARLDVVGGANLDQLNVSGIATLGAVDINGIIDIDGQLDIDELVVAGVATFSSLIDANNRLDVVGGANLDQLNVSGVSTFTGDADFNGHVDIDGHTELDNVNISGVTTFQSNAFFGDGDILRFGAGEDLEIYHSGSSSNIRENGTGNLNVWGDNIAFFNSAGNEFKATFTTNGSVGLYFDNANKFETTGYGATVFGTLQSQQLNVTGVSTFTGDIDANGNLDVDGQTDLDELIVAGVSTFSAAVDINSTLDVDGDTQVDDLNVAGVATFSSLIDANNRLDVVGGANLDQLNVAGVSTFGGVSTFNDDVRITAGGLDVVGVATFSTNVNVTGTLDAGLIDGGTY